MQTSCLAYSSDSIARKSLKAPAWVWPRYTVFSKSMRAECGRKRSSSAAQLFISLSGAVANLRTRRLLPKPQDNHERERRHPFGGRQSGRHRSCSACAAPGKTGEQYFRRPRRRGGFGFPFLSRRLLAKRLAKPSEADFAGFETAQNRRFTGTQRSEERSTDQDDPGCHYDFFPGRTRPGRGLPVRREQLHPETGGL